MARTRECNIRRVREGRQTHMAPDHDLFRPARFTIDAV
jgi:hypothetical protein